MSLTHSQSCKALLSMQGISVRRGGQVLLQDINWTVFPGEHWAILGGNGAGKTSLLNVLLGYLTPSEGTILMPDRGILDDSRDWDAWRRRIGFVSASVAQQIEPAEPATDIILSGRYAMVNYWRQRTPVQDRRDAEAMLDRVECGHLSDSPWSWLSQGERQRLLIGRALMAEPLDLLVLDEPCAGLDPVAREHFIGFLQRFATGAEGGGPAPSILLVTHHVEEIIPEIGHVLLLRQGRLLDAGPKSRLLNAAMLGETYGNPVRLLRKNERYRLEVPAEGEDGLM
ncbi:MAG: ATP-binding cassette domain-containing protein [Verrucomicrobiales bacterium]|nr:ATP-binding cassette domain-containing protein [Verrucomicrobiales bacterium]